MSIETVHPHPMTNTHILVQDFEYFEPTSLAEAISILSEYGNRACVLAGGTFLLVQMKMENLPIECLVNINKLPELDRVSSPEGKLLIGARSTIRTCRNMPEIRANYTALAEACDAFGSMQIQMMGTIGGNMCNGSPASDTVPALMALDAQLALLGPDGERVIPIEDFLLEPGKTNLRSGELLTSIHLPPPQPNTGSAFIKVSRVEADLAKVSAAATLVRDGDRIVDCRLTLGAVAPTVIRARQAEASLIGRTFDTELALQAGSVASEEVSPIDDVRSTAWYRRQIVKALIHDVLNVAWERANGGRPFGGFEKSDRTTTPETRRTTTLRVGPGEKHLIEMMVNGKTHSLWVEPNELLLNILRDRLQLTGTKYGCGIGECGACTVQLNGKPALSCLVLAIAADGSEVLTVEGLQAPDGQLDPVQEAFIENKGFQCGYCTPGILMITKSLLEEIPSPTEDDVRSYLRGNRCRCTGFTSIVRSVMNYIESHTVN
ncbi:MAG: 2Fe-2S iron-sulfur cluster binding domain-containing protein [Anaerolineales bacterium]|nr:MAG: 2Fe-2S iron-sulfur cluster binding domain-containing protein [Anaerolineales bacterium]